MFMLRRPGGETQSPDGVFMNISYFITERELMQELLKRGVQLVPVTHRRSAAKMPV